jgi:hypothetical protein
MTLDWWAAVNKLDRMKPPSMEALLQQCVEREPGVTSARLFEYAREWHGKLWSQGLTGDFERQLLAMRNGGYRCTNKQWYPQGHTAEPERRGPSKDDPRQTRMFG